MTLFRCTLELISPRYSRFHARYISHFNLENIRNLGIIAHIDAGKTTLTERLLHASGVTKKLGNVDEGNTVMDFMEEERNRGITIQSAAISFPWSGSSWNPHSHQINLIDTPGHVDFGIEVERSLRVLDSCIMLLDGVHGVQSQTVGVWRKARSYQLPSIAYVNKMDREACRESYHGQILERIMNGIHKKLSGSQLVLPLQLPIFCKDINADLADFSNDCPSGFCGVVDLSDMRAMIWNKLDSFGDIGKRKYVEISIFDDKKGRVFDRHFMDQIVSARSFLIETLSDLDDQFLEYAIDKLALDQIPHLDSRRISDSIRAATCEHKIMPLMFGSAFKNIGVEPLLNSVVDLFPSPKERPAVFAKTSSKPSKTVEVSSDPRGPLVALAFKVVNDPQAGLLTFCRVYSGKIKDKISVHNTRSSSKERVLKLYSVYAGKLDQVDAIEAGNIGIISGLNDIKTGDTLIDFKSPLGKTYAKNSLKLDSIRIPPPVFVCSVEPDYPSAEKSLKSALQQLEMEDPSFHVQFDEESGQTLLSGMGELHLEILLNRLRNHFKVPCSAGKPFIFYKETLDGLRSNYLLRIDHELDRDIFGKKHRGSLSLEISQIHDSEDHVNLDSHENVIEVDPEKIGILGNEEQKYDGFKGINVRDIVKNISMGLKSSLMRGPLLHYPLANLKIRCSNIQVDENHTEPLSLRLCASEALKIALGPRSNSSGIEAARSENILKNCPCTLLEPRMKVSVSAPQEYFPRVIQDLTKQMNAQIIEMENSIEDESQVLDNLDAKEKYRDRFMKTFVGRVQTTDFEDVENISKYFHKEIIAFVPVSSLIGYASRLRSITQGHGSFSMDFSGYEVMSRQRILALMKELRGI